MTKKKGPFDLDLTPEAIESVFEKMKKKDERFNEELKERAKSKEELIVVLSFIVKSVFCKSQRMSHTPRSEIRYGGSSPSYFTGTACSTELTVQGSSIVKTIKYSGPLPLEAGDEINVHIFAGESEYEKGQSWSCNNPRFHLVERELEEVEEALKIEKIRDSKVVATYV